MEKSVMLYGFDVIKNQPLKHEFQPLVPSPNPFEHNRPKVVLRTGNIVIPLRQNHLN